MPRSQHSVRNPASEWYGKPLVTFDWPRQPRARYLQCGFRVSEFCATSLARRRISMAVLSADEVRRTPAYTFTEAAHYLRLPVTTLRAWCTGQDYRHKGRPKRYERVIRLDG